MADIIIKNIPDQLVKRLKTAAHQHHRSLNSEVIYCLRKVLYAPDYNTQDILEKAWKMRDKATHYYPTNKELKTGKANSFNTDF